MDDRTETNPSEAGLSEDGLSGAGPVEDGQVAEVSLDIDASCDAIWQALTTDRGLAAWMGEGASLEPRPGGAVVLPDPVGGETRRGRVDRIEDGRMVEFIWWPALRPAEQTRVSIMVESTSTDRGCRVRVIERPPARLVAAASAEAGAQARARAGAGHRQGVGRVSVGLWAWRLAVLSVATTMSRI